MRILQLVPVLHHGDAVGGEVLFLHRGLRAAGADSRIFCLEADPEVLGEALPAQELPRHDGPDATVILHFALPSPLTRAFAGCRGRKILIYHNVTPASFVAPYSEELAHIARAGRSELASLRGACDLALGDSEFNRRELEDLGFPSTDVLPLPVDLARYDRPSSRVLAEMFRDDFTNLLFVGRVAPNKKHEDLLRMYAHFKRHVRERSRLILVGSYRGFPRYYDELQQLLGDLKLGDVYFTGHVTDWELATYYRLADVFVSMSEHEGFCVPLIEAMHFRVPILAYAAGAVPGTLRGSGVLFRSKAWALAAEMALRLAREGELRRRVLAGQDRALAHYRPERILELFRSFLE